MLEAITSPVMRRRRMSWMFAGFTRFVKLGMVVTDFFWWAVTSRRKSHNKRPG